MHQDPERQCSLVGASLGYMRLSPVNSEDILYRMYILRHACRCCVSVVSCIAVVYGVRKLHAYCILGVYAVFGINIFSVLGYS